MEPLTPKQQQILKAITDHVQRCGYAPSIRELGRKVGIRSPNGVRMHLLKLAEKGYLSWQKSRRRGLELAQQVRDQLTGFPLIGRVAAGAPILATENREGFVNLEGLFGQPAQQYLLRIKGDSMIDAGIQDGDFVVVRPQETVPSGAIGVAIIGEEATVKKIVPQRHFIRLVPANPRYPTQTVPASELRLGGRVIGVIRKLAN